MKQFRTENGHKISVPIFQTKNWELRREAKAEKVLRQRQKDII